MIRDGEGREYVLDPANGTIKARHRNNHQYININSLIASTEFADLRALAMTQQRMLRSVGTEPFLEPRLTIGSPNDEPTGLAALKSTLTPTSGRTRIVLLDGAAGAGKTRLLERLTWERAGEYTLGIDLPPILYVSSRGRRLSNLRDTLAGASQITRAKFTFEQIPLLTQRGLLSLAIDGFDELVDADGYQDAWYALRDFLDELGGGGLCLLAGRDTFFDQQGFLQRLQSTGAQHELIQAHLLPITPERAKTWLTEQGWQHEDAYSEKTAEFLYPDAYTLRPYFLSVLAKAKTWDNVTASTSARAFLVNDFIEREAHLLEKMIDIDHHQARKGLEYLFEHAAMDMAERESAEVDIEYLALLCEIAFSGTLNAAELRKLQHKAGSFALLEPTLAGRLRSFPHSEITHHFLSHGLIKTLSQGTLPLVIRRGVLGTDFLEVYQDVFYTADSATATQAIQYLHNTVRHEISGDRLPYNGGALLISSLARELAGAVHDFDSLDINEAVLTGTVRESTLKNVRIAKLDAQSADLSGVNFEECHISTLIADELTRFGPNRPKVSILHLSKLGTTSALRTPAEILEWLEQHSKCIGAPGIDNHLPLVQFFERVCRRSIRQFYLRPGVDDPASDLLEDPLWPEVESILTEHGFLEKITKPVSGPSSTLVHIKAPRILLNPFPLNEKAIQVRQRIVTRGRQLATTDN